ncbi:unnamed protein product [Ceutorhynchus assimilis]|uniref:Nucleoporin NSP1-like C-terminal domain-containing protein n=1 Tax=Ceutorhynchus assimilis TaxID=467358 RepID=A0A9N9MMF9_9CUCU|nr:unnamed protein product [Ceutorhynchus assimilis]
MSFNFGTPPNTMAPPNATAPPKAATGFTLPSSTPVSAASGAPGGGFAFNLSQTPGAGDNKQTPSLFSQFKPATPATPTGLNFNLGQAPKTAAPTLSFGTPTAPATTGATAGFGGFGLGTAGKRPAPASVTSTAATSVPGLQFSFSSPASAAATTATTTFTPIVGSTATSTINVPATAPTSSAPKLGLGVAPTTTTPATTGFSLGLGSTAATTTTVTSAQSTTSTAATTTTGSLTFAQLEDAINKWTIDLEEQGKFFINQAKQLNAWDTLLISNGDKILNLNTNIVKVQQQQSQLDQELDFISAQQKELEELLVPLETELMDVPATDINRNQMYQFSEIIDSQLKQISDDLKEIVEIINGSNKDQDTSNPIQQVSKILNSHMHSLQWIEKNTSEISKQIEELSKMDENTRKNISFNGSNLYQ